MRDRQPLQPNRVLITPEDGSASYYAVITRADEPVDEGHRLNKYTLLKDETCTMLGGDPQEMVPDDALQTLAALACSSGGSGDVGDLEDYTVETGTFTNAGAGWNTFKFREAFEGIPVVMLQAEEFDGIVQIMTITAEGFLYCLRTNGDATTSTAVTINYAAIEYGGER